MLLGSLHNLDRPAGLPAKHDVPPGQKGPQARRKSAEPQQQGWRADGNGKAGRAGGWDRRAGRHNWALWDPLRQTRGGARGLTAAPPPFPPLPPALATMDPLGVGPREGATGFA